MDEQEHPRYLVRQVTDHKWNALKLYDFKGGEQVYDYICPAAENCASRAEAEAWIARDRTGVTFSADYADAHEPLRNFRAYYDGLGNVVREEGEQFLPACAHDYPSPTPGTISSMVPTPDPRDVSYRLRTRSRA